MNFLFAFIAIICAFAVVAISMAGFFYLLKRTGRQLHPLPESKNTVDSEQDEKMFF